MRHKEFPDCLLKVI